MITARSVAVKVLNDILVNGSYSNIAADVAISSAGLSKKDSGLATALIYGCLQRLITIDRIIEVLNDKNGKKIDSFVLSSLRVGIYQILFMDRIPVSAAVNESVNVVKNSKYKYAAGFINAILRKCASKKEELLNMIAESRDISFKYSCTVPLLKNLIADYGQETTEKFLEALLKAPETYIRVNTLITDVNALITSLSLKDINIFETELDSCCSIRNAGSLEDLQEFKNGLFYVQDLASQTAISALKIKPGMSVLDICSAPGGKSFTAAMYLKGKGLIDACDIYEKRVGLIRDGAERLGITNINTFVADALVKNEQLSTYDRIICDVPCSGFGVIRRKPEIKLKLESFDDLEAIQLRILINAASYLKLDGKLMYSTCTLRKRENEDIIKRFLEINSDFEVENMRTLFPHSDGTDGFFYCILKRK